MREKIGDHRPPLEQASVDKDLAIIHSKVDDAEFIRLSAEGRTMTGGAGNCTCVGGLNATQSI